MRAMRGARYYAQGSESLERGDTALAIVELEHAAVLVPQASEVQNHLGLAYWADGQPELARSAFDRALVLDCDNAAARRNLDALGTVITLPENGTPRNSDEELDTLPKRNDLAPGNEGNEGNAHGG